MSSWRVDVSPLRTSRDFRLLFSAGVVTFLGSMFTMVALPLQAQQITGSFVAVGLLSLVELLPVVVFGLWGGALADHMDRRLMILGAEVGSLLCSVALLVNALSVMSPYGPEEKQALLEADDLKARADVLVALAEMELASTSGTGGTLQ